MANNIKIVGNILNTTQVSRYSEKDRLLISSQRVQENFGEKDDYIEYYIYDAGDNLLYTAYNYLNYKLPSSSGLTPAVSTPPNTTGEIQTTNIGIDSTLATPTSSLYPIIEIDPVKDLQDIGYSSGEFKVRYNFFQNKISKFGDFGLYVKEISQDRTEVRLASTTLTDDVIESATLSLIDEINKSPYYLYYLLNFGDNKQYVVVNVALNKDPGGYEVLFKLYEPLPLEIQEKTRLWVVEEKTDPYVFDINLDKLILPPPPPTLRGPNFDIDIDPNQGTISSAYQNYDTLVSDLSLLQQTSYHKILNLLATQSIDINIDYTDYNNFVFFGSAKQRLFNFYDKATQIEYYSSSIATYTPQTSSNPSLISVINQYTTDMNNIISQFDGYESYLYFESSSYAWPKAGSTKPYSLLSTGSATVINWYNNLTGSAQDYDTENYDNLVYAIPPFLRENTDNQPFLTFLNMVGHYFDNIWIYLKSITDVNLANNNLEVGVSKDLVFDRLRSLGVHLYNSQAGDSVSNYLVGANTGSATWDNDTTVTGSYLNNISRKDLVSELYKRIYHNLPYLLKTKGTVTGLNALMTTFGLYTDTGIDSVKIGNQIWSTTNYQGTTYNNGDPILEIQSDAGWAAANTAGIGAWCYYSGSYEYAKYGKLYNWYAINDPRGFAPQGWHVPTQADWEILTGSLGSTNAVISNKLRTVGSNYWVDNSSATNESGLSLVGNGTRRFNGSWTINNIKIQSGSGLWAYDSLFGKGFELFSTNPNIITISLLTRGEGQAVRFVKNTTNTYNSVDGLLNVKEYGGSLKTDLIKGYNNDKVRIVQNNITGSVLSPILSLQTFPTDANDFRENDSHYIDISFSPQNQIDNYISGAISSNNPTWSLDDYIGDPRQQYSSSYTDLDAQRKLYFETGVSGYAPFTASLMDYNGFIRLVEYFDNSLFKMLEDFVPERASLSTGVTINSPVLERNKVVYANPTATVTQSAPSATITTPFSATTQYGTFYNALPSMGWYNGELSGSAVNIHQYFEDNYNPYLQPSGTVDQNFFQHSDWNVLLNNVSKSVQSIYRQKVEYINEDFRPTSSILVPAELQDSYLSLRSYNMSRYEGAKVTSLKYNTYTSASYTGSDGFTILNGDKSYGKTAAIDRQSYKIGWVKNIPSQSLNFLDKTQIQLKYLVDKNTNITDLTLKNNNLFEVQNTFKSGDTVVLSLSDAIKPSFQKNLDGTKTIFKGGYSYDPLLFRENNEILNFRLNTPIIIGQKSQGYKAFDPNFYSGRNIGNEFCYATRFSSTYDISAPPSLWGWYINFEGFNNQYGAAPTSPMASQRLSLTDWIGAYGSTLETYAHTKYQPGVAASQYNCNTANTEPDIPVYNNYSNDNRFAYIFENLEFLDYNSTLGGYYNEDTNIGNSAGTPIRYTAPLQANYTVKCQFPVSIMWSTYYGAYSGGCGQYCYGDQRNGQLPHHRFGLAFKMYGLLEKSTNSGNTWDYVAATRIVNVEPFPGSTSPTVGTSQNTITFPSNMGRGGFNNGATRVWRYLINLQLVDDTTNQPEVNVPLNPGDKLRMRFVFLDIDNFFKYGGYFSLSLGKPTNIANPTITNIEQIYGVYIPFSFINGKGLDPYFQIENRSNLTPQYQEFLPITGSQIFTAGGSDELIFSTEMITPFTTSSIFSPNPIYSTTNYYSPVIDNFTIQPYDLIRLGSIKTSNPYYYTVKSSKLVTSQTNNYTFVLNSLVSLTPPGSTTPIQVSTLSYAYYPSGIAWYDSLVLYLIYYVIINPLLGNPFTILDENGSPIPGVNSNPYNSGYGSNSTISVNPTSTKPYYEIHIIVSNNGSPTITSNYNSWQVSGSTMILQNATNTAVGKNVQISTQLPNPYFLVKLDRNIDPQILTLPSQNFAILRPKPDETSVIINFSKQLGDVSQTILIPQDANDEIKNNVGTIFQKLNTDLSNQP